MKGPRCAMVLSAIDRSMKDKKRETVKIASPLTVEHVLPQLWEAPAWSEPTEPEGKSETDESPVERRSRLLHSLGNLTLLTRELNSAVRNGPYDVKRPEIARHSVLRLNTYFQDTLVWNEAEIQKRGRILFDHATGIWPYPTELDLTR